MLDPNYRHALLQASCEPWGVFSSQAVMVLEEGTGFLPVC